MSSTTSKAGKVLFEIPIRDESDGVEEGVGGGANDNKIVCTEPAPRVYLLTFRNAPDNRLVTSFCKSLLLSLSILQHRHPQGVVITTSSLPKFYSNGMDISHSNFHADYLPTYLYGLFRRLLTFPMPTIALVNGHAFAGGFMLAMMHDYRVMNPGRGWVCLNELELGLPLRGAMLGVFREKVRDAGVLRKVVLEAKRFSGQEALQEGLVDGLGGLEETLRLVEEWGLVGKVAGRAKGRSSVYGKLKREMWRGTIALLDDWVDESTRLGRMEREVREEDRVSLRSVEDWEGEKEKAKAKL